MNKEYFDKEISPFLDIKKEKHDLIYDVYFKYKEQLQNQDEYLEEIMEFFKGFKFNNFVVGLSGGIDSTLVAFLLNEYRKINKKIRIIGVSLPNTEYQNSDDAKEICKLLDIDFKEVKINYIHFPIDFMNENVYKEFDKGNLQSELRAVCLSRIAANNNAVVVGTGNFDEDFNLGYFTKRGDGAVDIAPIVHLHKWEVRKLASFLNIPEEYIYKKSTAGLWNGQTDEKELGFSYIEAQIILDRTIKFDDKKLKIEFEKKKEKLIEEEKIIKIITMKKRNKHKTKEIPNLMNTF